MRPKPPHTFEIIQTHQYARLAGIAEQHHIAHHKTHKRYGGWNKTKGGEGYIPEIGWGAMSGENHPSWIDGRWANDPKLYDKEWNKKYNRRPGVKERERKRNQTPERKLFFRKRSQTPEYKEYHRIRRQIPEVKLRHNMLKRIRVARNREIQYFIQQGLVL